MAYSHPQGSDEAPLTVPDKELKDVINELAFSRQNLLAILNELSVAFQKLTDRLEEDEALWRTAWLVKPSQASEVTVLFANAKDSFQRALNEVERPLQLAERAARQLLVTPSGNTSYDVSKDVDADDVEVQRRINECQQNDFWRRVANRYFRGTLPVGDSSALARAEYEEGTYYHSMKYWREACDALKGIVDEVKNHLLKTEQALHVLAEQMRHSNDRVSRGLELLANELQNISSSTVETFIDSFPGAVRTLMNIMKSVAEERNQLNY